jgi:uncharacterized coiled-coil protein SlyX
MAGVGKEVRELATIEELEERIKKLEEKIFMQDEIITKIFDASMKFLEKETFTQEDHIKIKLLRSLGKNLRTVQELKKLEKADKDSERR